MRHRLREDDVGVFQGFDGHLSNQTPSPGPQNKFISALKLRFALSFNAAPATD
ncbi:MAG: hypothetical protein V4857_22990 [Pseudomonadota bacterium]